MTGRSSHSHASLNPGGGQNEVSTIDEQYGIHCSIHMDKHQIEGGDFEDPQAYSQRHLQYGYNQWNNHLQPSNQQPQLYSKACQSVLNHHDNPQYNGRTEERCPPQYHEQVFQGRGTDPALPTTAAPPYDDTFHSFGYDDQILATGEQFNQSAGPPESANELQGRWNAAQHNAGHDVDAGPGVDQLYDTRIEARMDLVDSPGRSTTNGRRYEPAADEQAGIPISTVLGRIIGWHAKLAHAFGQVRTDHRPNGVSSALASPIDPALSHDHTATVPAQAFDVFPATQQPNAWVSGQVVEILVPDVVSIPSASNDLGRFGPNLQTDTASNDQLRLDEHTPPSDRRSSSTGSVPSCTPLRCSIERCAVTFGGRYAKGNLARHVRSKHRGKAKRCKCEVDECSSVFNREDARLKHYRIRHPHLPIKPAVLRKTSTSTSTDPRSDPGHVERPRSNHSQASLHDSQGFDDCDTSSLSFSNDDD